MLGPDRIINLTEPQDDISTLGEPTVYTKDSVMGTAFVDDEPTAVNDVVGYDHARALKKQPSSSSQTNNKKDAPTMFSKATALIEPKGDTIPSDDVSFSNPYQ